MSRLLPSVLTWLLASLLLWGGAAAPSAAGVQDGAGSPQASRAQGESARERWSRLSPEEQQRVRARFERLQQMSSKERAKLERRARERSGRRRQLLAELSPEERARLASQPPERREQLLREMDEDQRRSEGRRIARRLPPEVRDSLRRATPAERSQRLEAFKTEVRQELSRKAVEGLAKALGYGPAEIERLERLPVEQRIRTVLRLQKRLSARQLEVSGLPEGMTEERWKKFDALPAEEYVRELVRLRRRGVITELPGLERVAEEPRLRREDREALRALDRALQSPPRDYIELSDLEPEERKAVIRRRLRERVEGLFASRGLLSGEQVARLAELDDEAYLRAVQGLVEQRLRQGRPDRAGTKRSRKR